MLVNMGRALTASLLTLAIVTAACGSPSRGTVEGVFYGLGSGPPDRPVVKTHNGGVPSPGTIRVAGPEGIYFARAGVDGHFMLTVPPGTYLVSGRDIGVTGGISGCGAPNIHVTSGKTTQVALTCSFH